MMVNNIIVIVRNAMNLKMILKSGDAKNVTWAFESVCVGGWGVIIQ